MIRRARLALFLLLAVPALGLGPAGCNTIGGFGKDLGALLPGAEEGNPDGIVDHRAGGFALGRVGAVHAGWRGMAAGVIEAAVTALGQSASEKFSEIDSGIG